MNDYNSLIRFKTWIRKLIAEKNTDQHWHKVGTYEGDIVIHGYKKTQDTFYSRGYAWDVVKPEVLKILKAAGIEYSYNKNRWGMVVVFIPVDQEACPQPRKRKVYA